MDFVISSARFSQSKASDSPLALKSLHVSSVKATLKTADRRPDVVLENASRTSSGDNEFGLSDLLASLGL